jgi:hypothetical protein
MVYSIYAWLIPSVISAITLILELFATEEESSLRPRFTSSCWFNNHNSVLAFFYGPISAFLVVNVVFYVLTVLHLRRGAQQSTGQQKSKLLLYVKLLVVMGLCWILEVVSWRLENTSLTTLVYILDTITCLQGVLIFLAYNCHVSVYSFIKTGNCTGKSEDDLPSSQDSTVPYDDNYTKNTKQAYPTSNSLTQDQKPTAIP